MRKLFSGKENPGSSKGSNSDRVSRHSSGWKELLKHLREDESLRILDIGPTSSTNINFITGIGHSIYMAGGGRQAGVDHPRPAGRSSRIRR